MKRLYSKDLGIIFLLTAVYIILVSFPNFSGKYILDIVFFVLFFLFTGYSLIALIRPKEGYKYILRKPVLLLEFSVLLTLAVSIVFRFSYLGLKIRSLVMVLSIIIMVMSIAAYIKRINHYNSIKQRNTRPKYMDEVSDNIKKVTKSSVEPSDNQDETPVNKAESKINKAEKQSPTSKQNKLVVTEETIHEKSEKQVVEDEKPIKTLKPKTGYFKLVIDLILIEILSIFILVSFLVKPRPTGGINYFLGLFYMLFLVGYPIARIIFAGKDNISKKLLIGISIGLSLPITSTIGLVLNSTKYGFSVHGMLLPLSILTILVSLYAFKRVKSVKS